MNASEQVENNPISQWVTFRLGEETYGVNVMQVQEVLHYQVLYIDYHQNPLGQNSREKTEYHKV